MKKLGMRGASAALLTTSLLACGVTWLLPAWEKALGNDHLHHNLLYPGQDGQSLFSVTLPGSSSGTPRLSVSQLDQDGNPLQEYTFDISTSPASSPRLIQGHDDDFYLIRQRYHPLRASDVLYVNPASGNTPVPLHIPLAETQQLAIHNDEHERPFVDENGKLVFAGELISDDGTDAETHVTLVGLASPQGQLEQQVLLPDISWVSLIQPLPDGHVLLVGTVASSAEGTPAHSAFIELDGHLNPVQRHDLAGMAGHFNGALTPDRLVFSPYGTSASQLLDRTGTPITIFPLKNRFSDILPTAGGFFSVDYGYEVCFHNTDLVEQWCSDTRFVKADSVWLTRKQITPEGELLLTLHTDAQFINGGTLASSLDPDSLTADFSVQGGRRYELLHLLYSPRGKRVAQVRATPYVERGNLKLCNISSPLMGLCLDILRIEPGTCTYGHRDTLSLPGRQWYTAATYCDGSTPPRPVHLLHWQP